MEAVGAAPVRARILEDSNDPRPEIEHHYRVEIELAERLRPRRAPSASACTARSTTSCIGAYPRIRS